MTSLCARRKREERLRKVLQARERVEQMKEEKKKQIEQKFAQIDEKTEKVRAWAVGGSSVDWTHGDLTGLLPHILLSVMGPAFCSMWRVEGLLWSKHRTASWLPPLRGCGSKPDPWGLGVSVTQSTEPPSKGLSEGAVPMGIWAWAPQAKEERLAEEKARKKAAAKKMEEVEARRKQEEEARRLKWLQQVRTLGAAAGKRWGSLQDPEDRWARAAAPG